LAFLFVLSKLQSHTHTHTYLQLQMTGCKCLEMTDLAASHFQKPFKLQLQAIQISNLIFCYAVRTGSESKDKEYMIEVVRCLYSTYTTTTKKTRALLYIV